MTGNRTLYLAFVASATLFLYAVFHQWGSVTADSIQEKLMSHRFGNETTAGRPDFEQIARKYGTDKVTTHQYQFMYDKYLSGIRDDQLKVLEIGLGCNMDYGPGASYYTWLEYFPHVNLYFIEYDGQCAKKYQDKTPNAHVFVGDQADTLFLAKFSTEATADGLFDIIIDDGGHAMDQQMTSLEFLWKAVKPGGLYVIEDLQTSYWESFGGNPLGRSSSKETTITYLYQLVDDLMIGRNAKQISHDLLSVDCMAEICALRKKGHM